MKKYYAVTLLGLLSFSIFGQIQENDGVKTIVSASASRSENLNHSVVVQDSSGSTQTIVIGSMSIVSGLSYLGVNQVPYQPNNPTNYTQNHQKDLGFPWGVLYAYNTFEQRTLKISKGYYSDRVDINWDVLNNQDKITGYVIYRTDDLTSDNPDWGNPIRTLSSIEKSYEDRDVEGAKLYRYKIKAKGVMTNDPDVEYVTYITGIGFRNPAAVITGNVSFEGGNPVEDVTIAAVPDGGFDDFGSGLSIPPNGYAEIAEFHESLNTSITLQAWIKPQNSFINNTIRAIQLISDRNNTLNMKVGLVNNRIQVSVNDFSLSFNGHMPSGNVNNKGEDILIPISTFDTDFVHFTAALVNDSIPHIYVNGRKIDAVYVAEMNRLLSEVSSSTIASITFQTNSQTLSFDQDGGNAQTWTNARVGGSKSAFIDEIRVWKKILSDKKIKRDYKRYLKGNEDGLHTYVRANERKGEYAYDLAHTGFNFHGNDVFLKPSLLNESNHPRFEISANGKPTNSQLGIFGITDENGSYVIPSIPYEGNGQTFVITPSKGVHEFNPSRELIYLGEGSTVQNNIDFIDISAFVFRGRVLYDSRGVFAPGPATDEVRGDIIDNDAYNAYLVDGLKYPKGEYWADYNEDGTLITKLVRYAPIPLVGANVYIDGNLVLNDENEAVVTDELGRFTVQVPIGEHRLSVDKFNHDFKFNGRYPAEGMINYFEDRDEEVVFIDETKVSVVGRVVGGTREGNKPIGFGFDGQKTYQASPTAEEQIYTSVNNIGTASITLGYRSPGATTITPEFQTVFSTHNETGEYKVDILPLRYELSQNDVYIPSQRLTSEQTFLEADQLLNFSTITPEKESHFVYEGDTIATSESYNYSKNFIKRVTPIITVLEQTSELGIQIGDANYTVTNTAYNLYTQDKLYSIDLQRIERYTNYETDSEGVVDNVPVTDGNLIVTNQLKATGNNAESSEEDEDDPSVIHYTFKAGDPNTDVSSGFLKTISLVYRLNGDDFQIDGYQPNGVILGALGDGGQTFQTAGPEVPDVILRDPPGSNSFATIEEGSTYSIAQKNSGSYTNSTEAELEVKLGVKFGVGGGLVGPSVETENYVSVLGGFGLDISTSNGDELTKTYTFGQAISTSDDPDWVGADADLYIGSSSNMFYGLMNQLNITDGPVTNNNGSLVSIPITTTSGTKYVSLKKILAFGPGEEVTTFIYSQRELINDIIPYYEEIVANYACIESNRDNSTPPVPCPLDIQGDGFKSLVWYENQIQLWRRAVQLNEETKYRASTDRGSLKADIISDINSNFQVLGNDTQAGRRLKNIIDAFFFENISFDSGVGSIEKSIETGNARAWEHTFSTDISASIGVGLGVEFGGAGLEAKIQNTSAFGYGYEQNETVEDNTVFSYTLQDNDDYNKLSIDVINVMDGNGPVFITRGGETSCPVEEAQYSYFFHNETQPVVDPIISNLRTLQATESLELSAGTIGVEVPYIAVENESIAGVPEDDPAEFTLTLRNDSVLGPEDSEFILYVNQNTNPNNAIVNLGNNGRVFFLDGSETVEYTLTLEKGSSDVYDYEDIEIIFESLCDDDLSESVTLSAYFIESCTRVNMLSPRNNWVKNNLNTVTQNRNIPLSITLNEFDLGFNSFERIALEYRQSGTANWTRLHTYVVSQTIYDQLIENGESEVSTLTQDALEISYAWDLVGQSLPDGDYELRAKSFCLNGTEYTSEVITGKVDLTPPTLFGTPQPTNGILSIGSDLIVRFNEPVKSNGTLTRYEFNVQKNQLPVNHEVSLSFNGSSNTAELASPFIKSGNFAIEFWLKNQIQRGSSVLLNQEGGLRIAINTNVLEFTIGGETILSPIANDGSWNHYALSYNNESGQLIVVENDNESASRVVNTDLSFNNNNPIVIGGNSFVGNLHDLRLWSKFVSRETAVASQNSLLNGNEADLIGYWPMNEGHGELANDISRFKHITLNNVGWEIFPNGTSYEFTGSEYLRFTQASRVIVTKDMDATISFWMKTNQSGRSTLLSNGRGDQTDLITNNNYRNKWSLELNNNGGIELKAEGNIYPFGSQEVNDDEWHHIAMVVRRNGNLSMFIDGNRVASAANSELGGFSGSSLFVGARGQIQLDGSASVDQYYRGYIDELRIWNTSKSAEQIAEDQYYQANYESLGLMLYAPFNAPEVSTGNGPRYYYPISSLDKASINAELSSGAVVNYANLTPPVKPIRPVERLIVNASINQDEVFLVPQITDWASVEQKVANITVANLYDQSDNRQLSPVTWSVFINKNPLKWYVEGYGSVINMVKTLEEESNVAISLVNRSGTPQPYSISGPRWLAISDPSGTVPPNSTINVRASINEEITPGKYDEEIVLSNDYGYDEKIQLNLRVVAQELNWNFDPNQYDQTMNVIGKIRVDNEISNDLYDKVIAYMGDEVRGVGELSYVEVYDEYFILLTIYGLVEENDELEFRIWDASEGRLKVANIASYGDIFFTPNELLGNYQAPLIFENTIQETQKVDLNPGWTWVSFNVSGNNFNDLNALTSNLSLQTSDIILSNSPAQFDTYEININDPAATGWYGTISANGGLTANKMYKIRMSEAQSLYTTGSRVDPTQWSFQINENWNWLPFVINARLPINEALTRLDAQPGDLIKSQSAFAIFDGSNGWIGTLAYLNSGEGYMLRASNAQTFSYPPYFSSKNVPEEENKKASLSFDYSQYSDNMNVIVEVPDGYDTVRFYSKEEKLVGEGKAVFVQGKYLAFVTVFGNTKQSMTIKVGCEDAYKDTRTPFEFIPNRLVGSLDDPLTLEFLAEIERTFTAYPNPADEFVEVAFSSKADINASIILYTMGMKRVVTYDMKVGIGQNTLRIPLTDVIQGSYVLHLKVGDRIFSKVIVKQ